MFVGIMNPVPTDTSLVWARVTASQESRKHDSYAHGYRNTAALSITVVSVCLGGHGKLTDLDPGN